MFSKRPHVLALCVAAITMAAGAAHADEAILVSLVEADLATLEAMKRADGVDWWIEAGEVMLLVGDDAAELSRTAAATTVIDRFQRIKLDELALHARGCGDNTTPVDESLVLIRGASYDLVRRPRSFSPDVSGRLPQSAARLGGPEWLPVERNSTIARLHRFDRPDGVRGVDPRVAKVVDRVDGTRWFANVETLAGWDRSSYSTELTDARRWIAGEFAALDLQVSEPFFNFNPVDIANVIGRFEGVLYPDEWIIVGGHYDSRQESISNPVNSPGADDNATGCSGVIEAARAIVPDLPQRSILFMCYSGEEQGLYGSEAHVDALQASGDFAKVKTMLNMDMIGWSADANLGVIIGTRSTVGAGAANVALAQRLADAAATYAPALNRNFVTIDSFSCCSDHMPYINAGIIGAMSIHRGSAAAYPHYHRTTDTPDNLGPHAQDIGRAIVQMNAAALAQIAGTDRILQADNENLR